ncbi:MAG: hypothetical protein H7Y43_06230 [Akkermansiaceae bacterium]|nr:hypothetical protein [Verrucomicrobiales bacterium]
MDEQPPKYRREFFKSAPHAWLGLTTLGVGFVLGAGNPFFLLLGAGAYALGWIYLPDMPMFRRSVDQRNDQARQAEATKNLAEFQQKRDAQLAALSPRLRTRYHELAEVCRQIEKATADGPLSSANDADPRLQRLDELMWTFLRLLGLEDSFERFLETERREDLPGLLRESEAEVGALGTQIENLKQQKNPPLLETKERLLQSRLEGLEVLRKRQERVEQAQANLALVRSEQERLDHQIKLIRADAVATRSTSAISARIDATVEQLDHTNKWLAEINEFKDVVGDLPATEMRVGYQSRTLPPMIAEEQAAARPITERKERS